MSIPWTPAAAPPNPFARWADVPFDRREAPERSVRRAAAILTARERRRILGGEVAPEGPRVLEQMARAVCRAASRDDAGSMRPPRPPPDVVALEALSGI